MQNRADLIPFWNGFAANRRDASDSVNGKADLLWPSLQITSSECEETANRIIFKCERFWMRENVRISPEWWVPQEEGIAWLTLGTFSVKKPLPTKGPKGQITWEINKPLEPFKPYIINASFVGEIVSKVSAKMSGYQSKVLFVLSSFLNSCDI